MASMTQGGSSSFPAAHLSQTGITVVVNPQQPSIDVVFVHGFTGHPYRTWAFTGKVERDDPPPSKRIKLFGSRYNSQRSIETYWPRDFLPKTIPAARVLTFGYDTKIRHAFGPEGSKKTVYDHGKELVQCLHDYRHGQGCPDRPILFIAHSLGGIVVKEALRQSQRLPTSHPQQALRQIFKSTVGLMFFGTPHRGADPRGPLQRIAQKAIEASGFYANKQIVATLMRDSERLQELLDEFGPLAHERNWSIYSFQEQHGVKAFGGKKVVEAESSCLGDSSIEVTRDIESNHMEMCRFASIDDPRYLKVISALRHIMDEHKKHRRTRNMLSPTADREASGSALRYHSPDTTSPARIVNLELGDDVSDVSKKPSKVLSVSSVDDEISKQARRHGLSPEQRQELVDSLAFPEIDARWANLRTPKSNTCQWILDSSQYKQWKDRQRLAEHHGFFWIKGKRGAGKSIIMKYLFSKSKSTIRGARVISFFFNARGALLERSITGLYRSLLFQLLDGDVALQGSLDALGYHATSYAEGVEWPVVALKNILGVAIEMLGAQSLICYIDALDECPTAEIRDMVSFFEEMGERAVTCGVRLNICFSSRHYPHITIRKGVRLTLEKEDCHTADIERYIDSELRMDQVRQAAEIKKQIVAKASGVFLWIALVIPLLNEAFDSGQLKELRRKLHELPPRLSGLFQKLLLRDSNDRTALLLCFQWVLFARTPMKLEELYFAIQDDKDEDTFCWDREQFPREAMERSLLRISKGLVEETRTKRPTIQFIHESVRDFLLKERGLQKIWSDLGEDFEAQSHCCLADRCIQHIQMISTRREVIPDRLPQSAAVSKTLRDKATQLCPLLEYATENVLYHSDAAQSLGITQSQFLEQFPLNNWLACHNLVFPQLKRRHPSDTSMLYVLAEQDLVHLIRIHPDRTRHFEIEGGRYGTPLLAALACGNSRASRDLGLQVFLDQELFTNDDKRFDDSFKSLMSDRGFDPRGKALLTSLAHFDCVSAIKGLLLQDVRLHEVDQSGRSGLTAAFLSALRKGSHELVPILLEKGADMNAPDGTYGRPLYAAACHGHDKIVNTLLEKGAYVNAGSAELDNALQAAARYGHDKILYILLEKGADVNAQGGYYGFALQAAAYNGHDKIVNILLENGADVNAQGGHYGCALQAARAMKRDRIKQILLMKGAGA